MSTTTQFSDSEAEEFLDKYTLVQFINMPLKERKKITEKQLTKYFKKFTPAQIEKFQRLLIQKNNRIARASQAQTRVIDNTIQDLARATSDAPPHIYTKEDFIKEYNENITDSEKICRLIKKYPEFYKQLKYKDKKLVPKRDADGEMYKCTAAGPYKPSKSDRWFGRSSLKQTQSTSIGGKTKKHQKKSIKKKASKKSIKKSIKKKGSKKKASKKKASKKKLKPKISTKK